MGACACFTRCHGGCETCPPRVYGHGDVSCACPCVPEWSLSRGQRVWGGVLHPWGQTALPEAVGAAGGTPFSVPWTPKGTFMWHDGDTHTLPLCTVGNHPLPPHLVGPLCPIVGDTSGRGECCPLAGDGSVPQQRGPSPVIPDSVPAAGEPPPSPQPARGGGGGGGRGTDPELLRRRLDPGPGFWTWGHRPGPLKGISPPPTHSVTASDQGSPPGSVRSPFARDGPNATPGTPRWGGTPPPTPPLPGLLFHPAVAGLGTGVQVEGVKFGVRAGPPCPP